MHWRTSTYGAGHTFIAISNTYVVICIEQHMESRTVFILLIAFSNFAAGCNTVDSSCCSLLSLAIRVMGLCALVHSSWRVVGGHQLYQADHLVSIRKQLSTTFSHSQLGHHQEVDTFSMSSFLSIHLRPCMNHAWPWGHNMLPEAIVKVS